MNIWRSKGQYGVGPSRDLGGNWRRYESGTSELCASIAFHDPDPHLQFRDYEYPDLSDFLEKRWTENKKLRIYSERWPRFNE